MEYFSPPLDLMEQMGTTGGDFVYLHLTARELNFLPVFARSGVINVGNVLDNFHLLISSDISENISHTWGKYDSMSGKLQELINDVIVPTNEASQTGAGVISSLKDAYTNGEDVKQKLLAKAGTITAANTKTDIAIVYQDSNNREYSFEIDMVAYRDPKTEVYDPIHKLFLHSCADANATDFLAIKPPAIFTVEVGSLTNNSTLLSLKSAALTAVQPTWKFPYKDGYPLSASVTLTFKEIPPLYKSTITSGSPVTVTRTGGTNKENNIGQGVPNKVPNIKVASVKSTYDSNIDYTNYMV